MSCGFWAARDIGRNRSNSTYQTIFCVGSHQHDGFEWGIDHFDNVPEKFWELKHAQHRGRCVPTSKDAGVRSNKIVVSIITEIVSHEFRGDTVTWWSGDPYVIWICRCHRGVLCSPLHRLLCMFSSIYQLCGAQLLQFTLAFWDCRRSSSTQYVALGKFNFVERWGRLWDWRCQQALALHLWLAQEELVWRQ